MSQIAPVASISTLPTASAPVELKKRDVAPILQAIGEAGYRGRKFKLRVQASWEMNNGDLVWGGGSREETFFVRQQGGAWEVVSAEQLLNPINVGPATVRSTIPADVMIVQHSHFCGQDCGFTFIVAPASTFLPPALRAQQELPALPAVAS